MKLLQFYYVFACILFAGVMALPDFSAVGVTNSGTIRQENGNSAIRNVANTGYIHQRGSNGYNVISNVDNTGYINQRKSNGNNVIHNVVNTNYINQRRNGNNVISNIVNHDVINH